MDLSHNPLGNEAYESDGALIRTIQSFSAISSLLLTAKDPWFVLPHVLELTQLALNASELSFIRLAYREDDGWYGQQLYSFSASDTEAQSQLTKPEVQLATDENLPWLTQFDRGDCLIRSGHNLSSSEQKLFSIKPEQWIVAAPVMARTQLVGSLVTIHPEEPFPEAPASVHLQAIASMLSAALEHFKAEDMLADTLALLKSILNANHDFAIVAMDINLSILQFNREAEELFGYTRREAVGSNFFELDILESCDPELSTNLSSELDTDRPFYHECEIRDPSGEYLTVEVSISAMVDHLDEHRGFVLFARDVTGIRQQQERTMRSQRMESLGMLAGGIAHDFNNIMMGILGYASLAQDKLENNHPAMRMLDIIEQSTERAAALTRELLAYARGGKYQSVSLRLEELALDMLNIVRAHLPKGVEVLTDFDPELPYVEADPAQLQQVLVNICMNAGEAIRDKLTVPGYEDHVGSLKLTTGVESVSAEELGESGAENLEPGKYVRLSVADDGIGMSEETLGQIFEPFFTTKFTGRGLGLSAVEGIIKNHDGFITVDSKEMQGTRFSIYLPPASAPESQDEPEPQDAVAGNELVLVVDDEEVVRQLALLTLTNLGYRVLLANRGREAVDILKQQEGRIDLIVLDWIMPGLSGENTYAQLRQLAPSQKILLASGYDRELMSQKLREHEAPFFLQKPYTPEALSRAVRRALDS